MANSVGALVVTLGLDAAEYTRGLTKAEYQAKQFAQNTRSAILAVGKVLGGLVIAQQVYEATKAIIAEAAALDDLADATGSSVEALSQLNNQAKISGTEFATLQTALLKLSAGMAGTDEETTKAKEALKLLGITTKDPAKAMQEIAVALDKYEDGVNKVGLAVALFGKQGGALLPVLKDMAQLQDVQATITTKQAKEAEELGKAWRRLSVDSETFKNAILINVVPPLARLTAEFSEGIKLAGGFWAALLKFGTINPFKSVGENLRTVTDPLQRQFLQFQQRREIEANVANMGFTGDVRDILAQRKPPAPALPGGGTAKALKEQTSEAQRYLDTLKRQLEGTQDLTAAETALLAVIELKQKANSGLTPELEKKIFLTAQEIDAAKELKKSEEERKKAAEEAAKAEQRIQDATNHAIKSAMQEVESIKQGNEQLQEQIAFLKGGEEAVNRLTDAKLADVIATKEAELAVLKWGEANEMWIKATEDQIRLLKERQGLIGDKRIAEQAKKDAEELKKFTDIFANSFTDAFASVVDGTKSLSAAFKDMEKQIVASISRIAAQNIAESIFGKSGSGGGGDIVAVLTKLAGAYFGGSTGGGTAGWTSGYDLPGFASGGMSRGGWATVGERGPELVHLPRGAQVIPNDVLTSKRAARNITVNINVPAGATRSTIDQTRLQFGLELQRVMDRSG